MKNFTRIKRICAYNCYWDVRKLLIIFYDFPSAKKIGLLHRVFQWCLRNEFFKCNDSKNKKKDWAFLARIARSLKRLRYILKFPEMILWHEMNNFSSQFPQCKVITHTCASLLHLSNCQRQLRRYLKNSSWPWNAAILVSCTVSWLICLKLVHFSRKKLENIFRHIGNKSS